MPIQSYYFGDLDGDLDHDLDDFWHFRTAYEQFNGAGSFARMTLGVPEPSTFLLLLLGSPFVLTGRRSTCTANCERL